MFTVIAPTGGRTASEQRRTGHKEFQGLRKQDGVA
jgi:hypothetical protein